MARINPRLAKIHRSYTIEEIAQLFNVHKNTVRCWVKAGLPILDKNRPMLILGSALREFLEARRKKHKRTCRTGEIYCVRCREPRKPEKGQAVYQPISSSQGFMVGVCPLCGTRIYRRTNLTNIFTASGDLHIVFPEGWEHLEGRALAFQNCDYNPRGENS